MIADMLGNKKLNSVASELFIRGKRLNVSTVCITQTCTTQIFQYLK